MRLHDNQSNNLRIDHHLQTYIVEEINKDIVIKLLINPKMNFLNIKINKDLMRTYSHSNLLNREIQIS